MSAHNGAAVRYLAAENRRYGRRFTPLACEHVTGAPVNAWRNNEFLAQLFDENGHLRLSVCRTKLTPNRQRWAEGITWDELQAVKSAVGFADRWAVEVFPPDVEVVDVANMRHLWLLDDPPAYGWRVPVGEQTP